MAITNDGIQLASSNQVDLEKGPDAGPRRPTVAEHITIPAHLLVAVTDRSEWTPDPERNRQASSSKTDSRSNFDVVRIASRRQSLNQRASVRAHSITVGGLGRSRAIGTDSGANTFAISGGRTQSRKTSLPTIGESSHPSTASETTSAFTRAKKKSPATVREPGHSATDQQGEFGGVRPPPRAWRVRSSSDQEGAEPLDSPVASVRGLSREHTILFTELSNYSLNSNKTSSEAAVDDDDADPSSDRHYTVTDGKATGYDEDDFEPQPPSRSATVLSKLRQASVVQAATDTMSKIRTASVVQAATDTISGAVQSAATGLSNVVRRSSLADVYEKAKTRSIELQRSEVVQTLFEYSIYVIIVAFIYFVLVGMPLWKGAVWCVK